MLLGFGSSHVYSGDSADGRSFVVRACRMGRADRLMTHAAATFNSEENRDF
jgi:hypothetical protein